MATEVDPSVRNVGLDIVRAACLIFVVLAHTNNVLGKYVPGYKIIFPIGSTVQEVFFSLSGFLIGAQLLKFINKDFTVNKLFGFYAKRWIRTIPFYFLFIVINYVIYSLWYSNSGLDFFLRTLILANTLLSLRIFSILILLFILKSGLYRWKNGRTY